MPILIPGSLRSQPQAPTDFRAQALSSTAIRLTWQNPPNADRIYVERSEVDDFQSPYFCIATVTVTGPRDQYDDTERSPNTRVYYRLIAANAQGQSPPTMPLSGITHANPPKALEVRESWSRESGYTAWIVWDANENPQGTTYVLELTTSASYTPVERSTPVTTTDHVFSRLPPNSAYWPQVRARNLAGVETADTRGDRFVTWAESPIARPITEVTQTSFVTSWDPNGNPPYTEYMGHLATTPDFSPTLTTSWMTGTQFRWTGLSPGTRYYFQAVARDLAHRVTPYSNVVSTTTTTSSSLPAPTDFQVQVISPRTLRLTWRNPPGPDVERIYIESADRAEGPFVPLTNVNPIPPQYDDALPPNTQRFYRLIAANRFGLSPPTDPGGATTFANSPLARPYSDVSVDHLTSHWDAYNSPYTLYIVELATQASHVPVIASATVTATSYTFLGVRPNTIYWGRVKARNLAGVETAYTQLGTATTRPRTPLALPMTEIAVNSLVTHWNPRDNPPDTQFFGELDDNRDFSSPVGETGWTTAVSFRWIDLMPGTTYHFHVKARNRAQQEAPYGNVVSARTLTTFAPPPPDNVQVQAISSITIRLSWSNPLIPRVSRVYIDRSPRREGPFVRIATVTLRTDPYPSTSQYDDTPLAPNSQWFYQLIAANEAGESPRTIPRSAVTSAAPPGARPFSGVGEDRLTCHWSSNGNPDGTLYIVELATQPSYSPLVASGAVTGTNYIFSGLASNTTYWGRVKAQNRERRDTEYTPLGSVVTLAVAPMAQPITDILDTSLVANWSLNRNPPGTEFYGDLSMNERFDSVIRNTGWTPITQFLFSGLTPDTSYYFRVRARNQAGQVTAFSTMVSARTLRVLPPRSPVTSFHATALTRQRIRLTWAHDGQRLAGFKLYRSLNPPQQAFELIAELRDVAQRTYRDTHPDPNLLRSTRYRMLAFGSGGESTPIVTELQAHATPVELRLRGVRPLTNQQRLTVGIQVTPGVGIQDQEDREVVLTVVRQVGQRRDQLLRDILLMGRESERSVELLDGVNELTVTAMDIVRGEPLRILTERVMLDREPPRVAEVPVPPGARRHRGVIHGVPRFLAHPVARFTKPGLVLPSGAVRLIQVRDAQGQVVDRLVPAVTPVLAGTTLFLRKSDGPQPLELASHSEYRLVFTQNIRDTAGNGLEREVTVGFQTTLDPVQPHVVVFPERPATRVVVPPGSLRQEGYLIITPPDTPLREEVLPKVQQATDEVHRVAHHFRLVVPGTTYEMGTYQAGDGRPLVAALGIEPMTVTLPYTLETLGRSGGQPAMAEGTLRIAQLNEEQARWEVLESQVDRAQQGVTARVQRLGLFTLIGSRSPAISAIFAFPVPFQPGLDAGHHTITFANTPKDTVIKVFTVAGDLVRELPASDDTGQVAWDVTNSAGERVASEVYLYVAEQGGARKTGKLVVIR